MDMYRGLFCQYENNLHSLSMWILQSLWLYPKVEARYESSATILARFYHYRVSWHFWRKQILSPSRPPVSSLMTFNVKNVSNSIGRHHYSKLIIGCKDEVAQSHFSERLGDERQLGDSAVGWRCQVTSWTTNGKFGRGTISRIIHLMCFITFYFAEQKKTLPGQLKKLSILFCKTLA